ncbi:MAG: bifunctional diguanylate cyclase/phosphodiesterase [Ilumatobacteraceae bacterium]
MPSTTAVATVKEFPMNPVVRRAPSLFAAGALAIAIAGFAIGPIDTTLTRLILAVVGVAACLIGYRINRMPLMFVSVIGIGGLTVTALTAERLSAGSDLRLSTIIGMPVIGITMVVATAFAIHRRRGNLDQRDAIDLATVTIGASLSTWILLTSHLMNAVDMAPALAILCAVQVPISIVLSTFVVDLLFTGLLRNRAMQLIVVSALVNAVGAVTMCLSLLGAIDVPRGVAVLPFVVAFLLIAASISHPHAPATMQRIDSSEHSIAYTPFRLVVTAACLIVPGVLVGAISPSGSVDTFIRVIAVIVLVATVVARLHIAVEQHEHARLALVRRLDRDELTGLPTRARFVDLVGEVLDTTWRSEFRPTIIQLNLDRFKNINDSLGHYEANRVLVAVSERLTEAAAAFDGEVARSGGDDFVIIDSTTRSSAEAMTRVESIRAALATAITVDDEHVFVTASFGVAVAPRNRTLTSEEFMRRADIATHRAKAGGRNGLAFFDDSMQAHLAHRMDVEHALHGAIGRKEMRLYHQPIVDVNTGALCGFEALIRWQRDGTIMSPLDFIPIAEDTGIINELGAWALNDALRELRGWIADGVVGPDTTVSVNVSPRQIADPGFAEIVRDALVSNQMSPDLLWLEMTESMMLEEPELAQSTLRAIREMGVRLALDDFGTGYSSLSLLQQFPIQRIKIDRAFVQGIAELGNDRSLVRTIIAMARSMGLDLVAEGVETVQQLQTLADLKCGKAQGFLISHPVPADAMRSTMVALDALSSLSMFTPAPPSLASERPPKMPSVDRRHESSNSFPTGHSRPIRQPAI